MAAFRFGLTLTQRVLGLLLFGFAVTALLFSFISEGVLEGAILEQTKQQARVFLLGLEREIQLSGRGLDEATLEAILTRASGDARRHSFVVHRLCVYDAKGRIVARAGGEVGPPDMTTAYGDVVRFDRPYMGDEVEHEVDPATGLELRKVDIIVPLHLDDVVVAGLEAEINLEQTLVLVRRLDDAYELRFLEGLLATGLLMSTLFWLVIRSSLVAPIQRLAHVTGEIAQGKWQARAEGLARDELGDLGHSVNRMAESIGRLMEEQEHAYLQSLQSLAKALEAKDAYTARHSGRVAKFSVLLGRRIGLSEEQLKLLKQGALMHDLGKIGIPDAVLNKPHPLTDAEYEVMRGHPAATAAIMRPLKHFREFAEIAAWHHERWDGGGYPDGLCGEAIPVLARIVAIADTWDAMTGDRVYRKGMSVEKALEILERERDSGQWDPQLLGQFIELVREEEAHRHQVEADQAAAKG